MKIVLDVLGGDNAPLAALDGAKLALEEDPSLELVLVGPEEEIKNALSERKVDMSRVEILPATEAVLNTDHPADFMREKPNCSLAVACKALATRDDLVALLSAGPTGALLAGGTLRVGRLPGVKRPALIANIPTRSGKFLRLLDAGANMDCKSEYLVQFAKMANVYLQCLGIEKPRVAILSVGMEEGKGDELTKETYAILKADPEINFVGNLEADKVMDDMADILVADGFAGNVFLKATEGAAYFVMDLFKKALTRNIFAKLGALLQMKGLKEAKKPIKEAAAAMAPLLGCKKLVCKCHGKADAKTIAASIKQAKVLAEAKMLERMAEAISSQN